MFRHASQRTTPDRVGQGRDVPHISADQGVCLALVHSEFCDLATTAAAHDHPDLGAGATEDRDVRIQDPGVEAGQRDMAYDAGREARDFEVTEGHAEVVGEGHHVAELEAARTGDEVVASSAKGCLAPCG